MRMQAGVSGNEWCEAGDGFDLFGVRNVTFGNVWLERTSSLARVRLVSASVGMRSLCRGSSVDSR